MACIFGMNFKTGQEPDFGSIEMSAFREFTLLSADVPKLNSTLTRANCTPKLESGSLFSVPSGCNAIVADAPAVWRYHKKSDTWYEVIPEDED